MQFRCVLPLALATCAWAIQPLPRHGLSYDRPATTWDEGLPLGNGMLGALVWGTGGPLKISLDRADLWDLRKVPEFESAEYSFARMLEWHRAGREADLKRIYEDPYRRPAPTKIPAGRIELTLPGQPGFEAATLDVAHAAAAMRFAGVQVEVLVHAIEPLGMIRVRGAQPPAVRLAAPPFSGRVNDPARGGIAAGDLAQLGYRPTEESSGDGWQAFAQTGAGGFRFAARLEWRREGELWEGWWTVASSFEAPDPAALAVTRLAAARERGWTRLRETHELWWAGFWDHSGVRLPNAALERLWYLEQYKFGAAARRGAPPITLQAVWTADDGKLPPWKGDYHHDLNTQLSYWPCYSGNHLETGLSYLDWLWQTRDTGFAWTKRFFGLPGLNVPMTADLNGNQIGGWRQYTHSATTAAWLAQHFYLHWRYSRDTEFLATRAWPYVRDAAIFIEAFTATRDAAGKRTHPLSSSPEINDNKPSAWFDTVTNYDLALDRWVVGAAAELATEMGLREEARRWRRVLGEFPAFAFAEDGRLLVAAGKPLEASHRHFSHLMAFHPLGMIDWEDGEPARRTIRAGLAELDRLGTDRWTGYSFSWLANMAARARDGARAERALEIFSSAFTLRNSFHVNGDQSGKGYSKFTYRPFTLEGNFAAAAGIQEMLLQSHRGKIRVFPAIPDSWQDVSFETLRAEGAFLVSAVRKAGAVEQVVVQAEKGGECRLVSPWTGAELRIKLKPGERKTLRAPGKPEA